MKRILLENNNILGKELFLLIILLLGLQSCNRHLILSKKLKQEGYELAEIKITGVKIEAIPQNYISIDYEFFHKEELIKATKRFKDNRKTFLFSRQFPIESRFKMVYDMDSPNNIDNHFFVLHLPIYDSIEQFSKTEGEIKDVSFYHFKNDIFYGGCHIIYSYSVNGKPYFGHKGLDLKKYYPKIENPKKELDLKGKKFVVEYDDDNPGVSRILLENVFIPNIE